MMKRALVLLSALLLLLAIVWLGLSHPFASTLQSGDADVDGGQAGPPELPELLKALSPEALAHLEGWLRRAKHDQGPRAPQRDIFRKVTEPDRASSIPIVSQPPPELSPLQLVGFIFSGGSVGEENPLAAVRFEGRMWLVRPGDSVGVYRVERLVVGEEIHLVDPDSGEKVRLILE